MSDIAHGQCHAHAHDCMATICRQQLGGALTPPTPCDYCGEAFWRNPFPRVVDALTLDHEIVTAVAVDMADLVRSFAPPEQARWWGVDMRPLALAAIRAYRTHTGS